jgi:hypothetical protein
VIDGVEVDDNAGKSASSNSGILGLSQADLVGSNVFARSAYSASNTTALNSGAITVSLLNS